MTLICVVLPILVYLSFVATTEDRITQVTSKSCIYNECEHNVESVRSTFPPLKKLQETYSLTNSTFWENDDWIIKKSGGFKRKVIANKIRNGFGGITKTDLFFDASEFPLSFSICGTNHTKLFVLYMNGFFEYISEQVENQKWTTFMFISKDKYTHYFKNSNIEKHFQTFSQLVAKIPEDAFFMIARYEYKEANHEGGSSILRIPNSEKSCLMIYVSLCKSCILKVQFREDSLNMFSSIKEIDSLEQWQAHKIKINVSVSNEVKFIRVQENSREKGYWKLDVRLYDENDIECGNGRWTLSYEEKCDSENILCNNKTRECFFNPSLHQTKPSDSFTNETTTVNVTASPEINHNTSSSNHVTSAETINVVNTNSPTTTTKEYVSLHRNCCIPSEDVIAYEIFVFGSLEDFNSTHGSWDGTNKTWPSKPKKSLQLTPKFWNPFKGGADDSFCDETCYNTTLEPNTKYWLMMRALTHTTYRDSSLLYFHTGNLTSEKTAVNLTTPSYPEASSNHSLFNETITFANLFSPSSNQSNRAHFILYENDIIPSSGEIIAYAIFLFKIKPINLSNNTWGHWNGTTRTWPPWPNNSLQITPSNWNPFNDTIHTCNFTIGADNSCCKRYCNNEPLEPNTNYWLMVRALTHTAYNDSSVLHFQTGSAITHAFNVFYVILPILLGVFLTLAMILIVRRFLIKRGRRTVLYNEEEIVLLQNLNQIESTVIDFADFENYCSRHTFLTTVTKKFNNVSDTKEHYSSTTGLLSKNINKNRDRDQIVPYDYNRVILKPMTGVGTDDYINASHISGYNTSKSYIACQSPKYYTVRDFWRMIWQESVSTIVMATNFVESKKRMCAEYWPGIESTVFECGEMIIKLITETTSEHYDCQKFEIVYYNITRDILQFHLKWNTDNNIFYPNNVLPVVKHIRQRCNNNSGPIVFHSGYGTGRTAILILCDLALEMIKTENKIDFFTLTKELRMQRPMMISNLEHYVLSHLIVNEYFIEEKSPFKYSLEKNINTDDIKEQLKYVEMLCRYDTLLQYLVPQNEIKPYSFQNILVRRYGNARNYLISQEPYKNQDIQFWKMVSIESVHCIFFLNKKFPLRNYRGVTATEVMKVNHTQIAEESHYRVLEVSLLIYQKVSKRITYDEKICVFEYKDWKLKQLIPNSINKFVSIVNKIHKNVKDEKQVLISCSDGYTASGLFVVLSYVIEKYENEIEIDVCNAIRIARREGKLFVNKTKQLTFIYECIKEYIQNYEKYQQVDV